MNSFQIECFLAVADFLNFAKAAENLNVTQPAVSHQIQSLENELNTKLFNRSPRNVSLTYDGELFLSEAKAIFIHFQNLKNKFIDKNKKDVVPFHIACLNHTTMKLLPNVLYRLSSEYPKLHPILNIFSTPQIIKGIEENSIDAALALKENIPVSNSTVYTELYKTPLVCVCDKTHAASEYREITFDDLRRFALIFYRQAATNTELFTLLHRLKSGKTLQEMFLSETVESALVLAESGLGVLVIPEIFLPKDAAQYRIIPIKDAAPLSFGVYYKKDNGPIQRDFLKLMRSQKNI